MTTAPFKQVSEREFDAFVDDYPRKLVRDTSAISEPPLVSFNDFTAGLKWPESIVAKYHDYPDGHTRIYWIKA